MNELSKGKHSDWRSGIEILRLFHKNPQTPMFLRQYLKTIAEGRLPGPQFANRTTLEYYFGWYIIFDSLGSICGMQEYQTLNKSPTYRPHSNTV